MSLINRIKDSFKANEGVQNGKVSFELPMRSIHEDHIANSNYIFVMNESPGFSERLLSKTLFVDPDFCYEINLRAFQKSNVSREHIQVVVKGQLPYSLKNLLKELLNTAELSTKLKRNYVEQILTDVTRTYYTFNLKSGLVKVSDWPYVDDKNKINFSLTELKFLEFAKELDAWTEKMYLLFVNEV